MGTGKSIARAILGALGGGAEYYGDINKQRMMSSDDLYNALARLQMASQLEQTAPMYAVDMDYKKALAEQARRPPQADTFDKKLALANRLFPEPSAPSTDAIDAAKAYEDEVRRKALAFGQEAVSTEGTQTIMPERQKTVAEMIADYQRQKEERALSVGQAMGMISKTPESKSLDAVVKELVDIDPTLEPDRYYNLLKIVVGIMGPDKALEAGFIDQEDLDSGVID